MLVQRYVDSNYMLFLSQNKCITSYEKTFWSDLQRHLKNLKMQSIQNIHES